MLHHKTCIVIVVLGAAYAFGCSGDSSPTIKTGCASDGECKGDRVCVDGACTPASSHPVTTVPSDVSTPIDRGIHSACTPGDVRTCTCVRGTKILNGTQGCQADGSSFGWCDCEVPCDLYYQTGCTEDEACYPANEGTTCFKAGTANVGEFCNYTNDCAGGGICVDGLCHQVCDAHNNASSDVSCASCQNGSQVITSEASGVGFCNLPTSR